MTWQRITTALLLCLWTAGISVEGQNAGLSIGSGAAQVGENVIVRVILDGGEIECAGFSFGISHDSEILELESIDQDVAVAILNDGDGPGFWSANIDPEGGDGGVVACLTPDFDGSGTLEYLPEEDDLRIVYLEYMILDGATPGDDTALSFTEDLSFSETAPMTTVSVTDADSSIPLLLENGDISVLAGSVSIVLPPGATFVRGDVDDDGDPDIADAVAILSYGFEAGDAPGCLDAADVDDDGQVFPLIDAVFMLAYLFLGGEAIPAPNECGNDDTHDDTDCDTQDSCEDDD